MRRGVPVVALAIGAFLAGCSSGSSGSGDVTSLSPHSSGQHGPSATSVTLRLSSTPRLGSFLVADGRTLYMYPPDHQRAVTCTKDDGCEGAWPPLFVPAGQVVHADPGVRRSLIGTMPGDGGRVVTYNHWPLYYYIGDRKPGQINGQGQGFEWYVIAADGMPNRTSIPVAE
jgi:predicted lipoprotein with Yx(FWY)xxD motif